RSGSGMAWRSTAERRTPKRSSTASAGGLARGEGSVSCAPCGGDGRGAVPAGRSRATKGAAAASASCSANARRLIAGGTDHSGVSERARTGDPCESPFGELRERLKLRGGKEERKGDPRRCDGWPRRSLALRW